MFDLLGPQINKTSVNYHKREPKERCETCKNGMMFYAMMFKLNCSRVIFSEGSISFTGKCDLYEPGEPAAMDFEIRK